MPEGSPADALSVDTVYATLRRSIIRGQLEPGTEVSQVRLAAELGVSRTPLREALRLLQREGLIDSRANRRFYVTPLSLGDFDELYALRLTVESMALRLSAPLLTPEERADLEGRYAQMAHYAAAADYERWEIPHREFHEGLVRHAGQRILGTVEQLRDHATRYRWLYMSEPSDRQAADREHRAILDAVQVDDVDQAARELVRHYARTPLTVMPALDPGYQPRALSEALRELTGSPTL